uniref:Uncharacterized protein n=1 Tax=Seriola dumerili TaxID=41447 RepID=A0A3B4VAK2_SERDU
YPDADSAPRRLSKKAVAQDRRQGRKEEEKATRKESSRQSTVLQGAAAAIMNSFVSDIFERIAGEASAPGLIQPSASTIPSEGDPEPPSACCSPGSWAKHAVSEGTQGQWTKYTSSK